MITDDIQSNKAGSKVLKTRVVNTIEYIDKQEWDSIIQPDHIICTYDYIKAMESAGINDCDYRYIMIYDAEKLVAHTCIYSMSFDLDIFDKGASKKIIEFFRKLFTPDFLRFKVIECGTPTALGNTVTVLDDYDKSHILKLITEEMTAYAREKGINILIYRDFYNFDLNYSDSLKNYGFKRVKVLPNAEVINSWHTFEEYMNDMRSRYRYRLKKFLRSMEKSSIIVEIRDHFSDLAEELTTLWFQIYNHAKEYKREILTPQYFINMDQYLKERSKVILFKLNGRIIAFDFIIIDDETLRPLFIGLDYKHNEENKLYFNILCQSVKMGIDLGKKKIEMGITTMGPKKEIGSEVIPAYGYMKHLRPLTHILITNLFSLFSPPDYRDRKRVFNRRYYERVYSELNLVLVFGNKSVPVTGVDISKKGIRLISATAVHKIRQTVLLVGFKTDDDPNNFNLSGKIVWVKEDNGQYSIGIRFVRMQHQLQEKLSYIINYQKLRNSNE